MEEIGLKKSLIGRDVICGGQNVPTVFRCSLGAHFINVPAEFARDAVLALLTISPEAQSACVLSENVQVRRFAALWEGLSEKSIRILACDPDESIREVLSQNPTVRALKAEQDLEAQSTQKTCATTQTKAVT